MDELVKPGYHPEPGEHLIAGWFDRPPTEEEFSRRLRERHQRVVAFDPDNLVIWVRDEVPSCS